MSRRPPSSTRTAPLFPYPTLVRSGECEGSEDPAARGPLPDGGGVRRARGCDADRPRPDDGAADVLGGRSEEHTSELQSLMRTSYAVFCLKKKKLSNTNQSRP